MAGKESRSDGVTIHEGPMADRRGTQWREDAVKLEKANQQMINNPGKSFPSNLTTIDKAQAARAKGDGGFITEEDWEGGSSPQR